MRYLLDTHALLWARAAPALLSEEARTVFESNDTTLYVSMATLWECAIKRSIGKLELPDNFFEIIADDYEVLGIEISHLVAYAELPMHHRDPFDRLLVVQAQLGDLTLLTRDPNIARYDVSIIVA